MSNYPDGVTGNEFEISGPDFEESVTRHCGTCGDDQPGELVGHRSWTDMSFFCDTCGDTTDVPYDTAP